MLMNSRSDLAALSEMSDRLLADIGVKRSDLLKQGWFSDLFVLYGPAALASALKTGSRR
jgi:Domain of unknown function (DUF1127)